MGQLKPDIARRKTKLLYISLSTLSSAWETKSERVTVLTYSDRVLDAQLPGSIFDSGPTKPDPQGEARISNSSVNIAPLANRILAFSIWQFLNCIIDSIQAAQCA